MFTISESSVCYVILYTLKQQNWPAVDIFNPSAKKSFVYDSTGEEGKATHREHTQPVKIFTVGHFVSVEYL